MPVFLLISFRALLEKTRGIRASIPLSVKGQRDE
jgi:hypothetical protein